MRNDPERRFELVNVARLSEADRAAVLIALLGLLELRAYRVTKSDGSESFGVISELDYRTSLTPFTWAEGHQP